jgi:hypothetical protein
MIINFFESSRSVLPTLQVEICFLRLPPGYSTVLLIIIYQVISGSACHLLPIEMMDVYMKVDSVCYRRMSFSDNCICTKF